MVSLPRLLYVLAGVVASGCFGPSLGPMPFMCGGDGCPPGYFCDQGFCVQQALPDAMRPPGDGGVDAVEIDGPPDAPSDALLPFDGFTCTPGTFYECGPTDAYVCNGAGNGLDPVPCQGFGCNMAEGRCNECTPDAVQCLGDNLVTCGSNGLPATTTPCAFGCGSAPTAHCLVLDPSNPIPAGVCAMATADTAPLPAIVNTGSGCPMTFTQSGGPTICMILKQSLNQTSDVTVAGGNALVIVTTGDLTLSATIDASATGITTGSGGQTAPGGGDGMPREGGGGGSFGGLGSRAGAPAGDGMGPPPGATAMGTPELSPLVGGAPGGTGGTPAEAGLPGGAGGAIQLVSCGNLTLTSTGKIDVSGGGGGGGGGTLAAVTNAGGGGGGGSGGAILLEAAMMTVAGTLVANGGGGGGGGQASGLGGVDGAPGNDGGITNFDAPATGGAGGGGEGGTGGNGAAGSTGASVGRAGAAGANHGAGGGAGGLGRIRLNVRQGATPSLGGARISGERTTGTVMAN